MCNSDAARWLPRPSFYVCVIQRLRRIVVAWRWADTYTLSEEIRAVTFVCHILNPFIAAVIVLTKSITMATISSVQDSYQWTPLTADRLQQPEPDSSVGYLVDLQLFLKFPPLLNFGSGIVTQRGSLSNLGCWNLWLKFFFYRLFFVGFCPPVS